MDPMQFLRSGIRQTNSFRLMLLAVVLMADLQSAMSQYVEIQVDLLSQSRVNSPMGASDNATKVLKGSNHLQWLSITVVENIDLCVTIKYCELPEGETPVPAVYLNNGTSNTEQALQFSGNHAQFAVDNSGRLIRKMRGPPVTLTAWVGLPAAQIREVMIEYN